MRYDEALAMQVRRVQATVNRRMQSLAARPGRQSGRIRGLIDATQHETRLSPGTWGAFFLLVGGTPVRRLERAVRAWARATPPSGTAARFDPPLMRVTTFESIVGGMQSQIGPATIPRSVLVRIVEQLHQPASWEKARRQLEMLDLRLSGHTMWATLDRSGVLLGGLSGLTAEQIACDLGLDDAKSRGETYARFSPLSLLQYDPHPQSVHIPTMVEAWAANPPNYYFSPAPAGAEWGLTRPWRTPPRGHAARARPEVVHEPSHSRQLISQATEIY